MRQYKKYEKGSTNNSKKKNDNSVSFSIEENIYYIDKTLGQDIGLVTGEFKILGGKIKAVIVYIDSITDKNIINRRVLEPVLNGTVEPDISPDDILTVIQTRLISTAGTFISDSLPKAVESLLNGNAVLFLNGIGKILVIPSRKVNTRAIEKPENEVTLLSSMEAFTEDLETNSSMIIKRLPIPELRFKTFIIGRRSRTYVKLVWVEGIANTVVVDEACRRIGNINIDFVDSVGILSELIEDKPLSIFPKYRQTERPDLTAKMLSGGYVILLCNNSPFAFLFPISLWDNFKTMDDYAEAPLKSSYLRLLRYIAFFISIVISPLYLSFVAYNHTITPPLLAINITLGRKGVPFPSIVELLLMTFAIGIIREAGIRMPGVVGYFIGTLGAVIIGQAAVSAGYISASLIIVIAASAISTFAISATTLINTSRLLNYFLILLTGIFGVFGLINGFILIAYHLVNLESFGIPYLYPLIPFEGSGLKDLFIRTPQRALKKRLKFISPSNRYKMGQRRD